MGKENINIIRIVSSTENGKLKPILYFAFAFSLYYSIFSHFQSENDLIKVAKLFGVGLSTALLGFRQDFSPKSVLVSGLDLVVFINLISFFDIDQEYFDIWSLLTLGIGEGMIISSVIKYLRTEDSGNHNSYVRNSLSLRLGQNFGMVSTLVVTHPNSNFQNFERSILCLAIIILATRILKIEGQLKNNPTSPDEIPYNVKIVPRNLLITIISALCLQMLFYLVIMAPKLVIDGGMFGFTSYSDSEVLMFNGILSIGGLLMFQSRIYQLSGSNLIRRIMTLRKDFILYTMLLLGFWFVLICLSYYDNNYCFLLAVLAVVYGFFSTVTYISGEIETGVSNHGLSLHSNFIKYIGISRFGPIISILVVYLLENSIYVSDQYAKFFLLISITTLVVVFVIVDYFTQIIKIKKFTYEET